MVAIVDQYGNPIQREVLEAPQTARVGALHQEFANHPTRGLTPPRLARILEEAEQGDLLAQNDLFDDMEEKDAHIFAEMQKRKLALLGLEWDIVPPRNASAQEEKAAGLVKEILQDMDGFEDVILDMAGAIGHGYSCQEIDWHRLGREWLPREITFRPQRWFTLDQATRTELRLRNNSVDGEPLLPFGWIAHRHQSRSGYLARGGLHRVLAWPFLFKNYSVRDLGEFLEIYGLPLRLGTYPNGATDQEKATLLRAVVNIGHAAAGIVPEGMAIEFKEAAKGAADPFQAMMDWCERSESKAILGQVLSAEAKATGMGSGVADLHGEVRDDLLVADARQVAGTVTRDLIYPIVALNVGGIDGLRRCPRMVFDTSSSEELNTFSLGVTRLINSGMQIPTRWVHEKTKIPQAEGDEPVMVPIKQASQEAALKAGLPGHTASLRSDLDSDVADRQAERLDAEGAAGLDSMIDTVRGLLDEVSSLEEFRDRLEEAYPDMTTEQLADAMRQALVAAHLAGRFDIVEEVGGA